MGALARSREVPGGHRGVLGASWGVLAISLAGSWVRFGPPQDPSETGGKCLRGSEEHSRALAQPFLKPRRPPPCRPKVLPMANNTIKKLCMFNVFNIAPIAPRKLLGWVRNDGAAPRESSKDPFGKGTSLFASRRELLGGSDSTRILPGCWDPKLLVVLSPIFNTTGSCSQKCQLSGIESGAPRAYLLSTILEATGDC